MWRSKEYSKSSRKGGSEKTSNMPGTCVGEWSRMEGVSGVVAVLQCCCVDVSGVAVLQFCCVLLCVALLQCVALLLLL